MLDGGVGLLRRYGAVAATQRALKHIFQFIDVATEQHNASRSRDATFQDDAE